MLGNVAFLAAREHGPTRRAAERTASVAPPECLILGGRRHPACFSQVGEKCRYLGFTHGHGMALVMKQDVATDPPNVCLFRSPAEVPESNRGRAGGRAVWAVGNRLV